MATDKEASDSATTDATTVNQLAEDALQRCMRIVANVNRFKQSRLDKIQTYRDLYAGKVKKKFRQPFNAVLPVFAGSMDTLMAVFNDDLALEFQEQEPADYIAVKKIGTLWDMETTSPAPNAKFGQKSRQDRSNAMFSGRGFMVNYAISDPSYKNCFEIYELEDAIFQPSGGAILQNHLYNGRQNIIRSASDLRSGPYDQGQVEKMLAHAAQTDWDPTFNGNDGESTKGALAKFKAMGLKPEANDYVGEQLFKLVEMRITIKGVRYYIVFSPWYQTWLRFDKFANIFSAEIDPWISWATHEDNKNFLSKSFADDLYSIADAIHTLINQELTNREKQNFNARGYDISMFPDVAKLDAAQTRPDALVPVTVPPGKTIKDGIFSFETAELQGTINLIGWLQDTVGTDVGVNGLAMGESQGVTKRASVVLAEQQALAKRFLLRSSPYTEAMAEIGKLFIQGLKDHMPASMALRKLGAEGEDWDRVIKRVELDLWGEVDIRIVSSALDMQNSQAKKKAKVDTLMGIAANQLLLPTVNPKWLTAELLRDGAELDDQTIDIALDTKNYGNMTEVARAHEAIMAIQHGQKPDPFYGATTLFMQIIYDFSVNNRSSLGNKKYMALLNFLTAHAQIVKGNMIRKAKLDATTAALAPAGGTPAAPAASSFPPSPLGPNPSAVVAQAAAPSI